MSILCATNIRSNPEPSITWDSPVEIIESGPNYIFVNENSSVRLHVNATESVHDGTWTCSLKVVGRNVIGSNDVLHSYYVVGMRTIEIIVGVNGESQCVGHGITMPF